MKKFFQYLLLIMLISATGIILTNQNSSRTFFNQLKREYIDKPCQKPLTYSIGNVDPRFHLSQSDFQEIVLSAEKVWEDPISRNLFQYDPNSQFKINLVYDSRQERTQESARLENNLETLENSHEKIINQYEDLNSAYKKRLDNYNKSAVQYEKDLAEYNSKVDSWNEKGGAPSEVYDQLKKKKSELQDTFAKLEKERKTINNLIGQTNDLVEKEKDIVNSFNSNLSSYKNKYGQPTQFDKGVYDGKNIDIFQYNEAGDLRLTIAHEFGHALGIDHLADPQSLMYYLMGEQDLDNPKLSSEDVAALKDACMIKNKK
ncbi:MAG TPA: matrixin family metalloprotease [Patescibacteria group bacterium]|nr:matrixin family metalloprotease [Patescibacteria group bacterium]